MILADKGLLFFVVLSSKMSKNATNCQCIQIYSNVCMMYDDQVKEFDFNKREPKPLIFSQYSSIFKYIFP